MTKLESRALALCLVRMAGADVHSPYTREHGPEIAAWREYEGVRDMNRDRVVENTLEHLDWGASNAEMCVVHAYGAMELVRRLGSDRKAAARILSVNGLIVPELSCDDSVRDWVEYLKGVAGE